MRLRIKYGLTKKGRFLSHLDMLRTWERALRRANIPMAFSQGFNPHPKFSFGSALAVGLTSSGEYMDLELAEDMKIATIIHRLEDNLPPAILIYQAAQIQQTEPSLMSQINRARYQLQGHLVFEFSPEEEKNLLQDFWNQENIFIDRRTKKGIRKVDIRAGIFDLIFKVFKDKKIQVEFVVQTGSKGNIRPEEVLEVLIDLGLPINKETISFHREGLYINQDGDLLAPLS